MSFPTSFSSTDNIISIILYLLFTTKYLKDQKLSNFEYYIILFTSIFGFFLLCGVNDLVTAYLAIELQGLAFYVLASFKKSSNFSIESGVKYFVLGSLSTALFLLGATFVYGSSGSILFTDFKDFFVWVFSANSFFLSFEFISQALESFQEKMSLNEDLHLTKLKVMSDKLSLLVKNSGFSNLEIDFLRPVFENFGMKNESFNKTKFIHNVSETLLKYYNESSANSVLDLYNSLESVNKESFLQASAFVSSLNDFFIENSYQNASVDLLNVLQDYQLDYESFIRFKNHILKANYYENEELENFYGVSNEEFVLTEKASSILKVNESLMSSPCFSNVCNLLECWYFSESVTHMLQFADFLETCALKGVSGNEFSVVFPDEFVIIESTNDSGSFRECDHVLDTQNYLFSIVNIINLNIFFSESFEGSPALSSLVFDLNFVIFGLLLIILALFFKLALAPFHLWAPDVYEGSPSSSTFFFMVISKFGIFVFLLRLCYFSFYSLISYWQLYSLVVATVSIFIGAVSGLKQRKLKSLLTYSSINNMGFVLLAFSVGGFEGVQVQFYYLIVYMLGNLCIWSIILNLRLKKKMYSEKQNRDLGDLALLQESNNVVAQGLGITLFSFAGLPPMVGFLAKMGVFKALSGVSIYYLSVINILFSVIATFYYLRIIKIIFFENILVGNLYETINTKKTFIIHVLTFLLVFLFINPMFLYLYSYKITLFLNKSFF